MFPAEKDKLLVCPIFAALPPEQQMEAFAPTPSQCRKVILATNIAETSITINGIRYVVDTGVHKSRVYHSKVGIDSLMVTPISRAAASQRTGRAGREAAGTCYRLYTELTFESLDGYVQPEIQRTNLANVCLQLKSLGIGDLRKFDFIDPPPKQALVRALENLYALGALDGKGNLSAHGKRMGSLPLEPMYSKAILVSEELGCSAEMLTVVSSLSVDSIFFTPGKERQKADAAKRRFASIDGDHLTLLAVWSAFNKVKGDISWCRENFINIRSMKKVQEIRKQLVTLCGKKSLGIKIISAGTDTEKILRGIVGAFFVNAAQRQPDGTYVTVASNHTCQIHPSSVLFGKKPPCVVYDELMLTQKSYMHGVSVVQPQWLAEMAPRFYRSGAVGPQAGSKSEGNQDGIKPGAVAARMRGAAY